MTDTNTYVLLGIDEIRPNRLQPRRQFDDEELEALADSIRHVGVVEPLVVRRSANGSGYELIAGERRWRAAQRARHHQVPCIVMDVDDEDAAVIALVENVSREDLNTMEISDAVHTLHTVYGLTQAEIAQRIGKDRTVVAHLLRIRSLPDTVLDLVRSGDLSLGHARALVGLTCTQADRVAKQAVRLGWSARKVEQEARRLRQGAHRARGQSGNDVDTEYLERRLADALGQPVRLRANRSGKGTLTVHFHDLEELDGICSRLGVRDGGC